MKIIIIINNEEFEILTCNDCDFKTLIRKKGNKMQIIDIKYEECSNCALIKEHEVCIKIINKISRESNLSLKYNINMELSLIRCSDNIFKNCGHIQCNQIKELQNKLNKWDFY